MNLHKLTSNWTACLLRHNSLLTITHILHRTIFSFRTLLQQRIVGLPWQLTLPLWISLPLQKSRVINLLKGWIIRSLLWSDIMSHHILPINSPSTCRVSISSPIRMERRLSKISRKRRAWKPSCDFANLFELFIHRLLFSLLSDIRWLCSFIKGRLSKRLSCSFVIILTLLILICIIIFQTFSITIC